MKKGLPGPVGRTSSSKTTGLALAQYPTRVGPLQRDRPRGKSNSLVLIVGLVYYASMHPCHRATSAEQAAKQDVPMHFRNGIGMTFIWILPGRFTMGSSSKEKGPRRRRIPADRHHPDGILSRRLPCHPEAVTGGHGQRMIKRPAGSPRSCKCRNTLCCNRGSSPTVFST